MLTAQVQTRCECQARLGAVVGENGRVLSGWVLSGPGSGGTKQLSPATGIGTGGDQFQIGWLCPHCGRNTVRSFYRGALEFSA